MAELKTLHNFFECERRDFYVAKRQILKALPKIINAVSDERLREALSEHLQETRGEVDRLERASESPGDKAKRKPRFGMEGILEERRDRLDEEGSEAVMNAAVIAGRQRVEHGEFTAYVSLMAWAKILGYSDTLDLLKANEYEVKAADAKLAKLAESTIKTQAEAVGEEIDCDQSRKPQRSKR